MPTVLVDTAAWLALVNTRDEWHSRATQLMAKLRNSHYTLVTTEFVLLEVANALCAAAWRSKAIKLIDGLRLLPTLQIVEADTTILADGWQLYSQRLDKDWSLTDCVSMIVMRKDDIKEAFTSDHHFEQAGFVKLL